jgi:hypothetical protein
MKIEINTKEDSHEEIRKVIKMLQHIIGDSQEIFTNEPQAAQETISPIANIFGDVSAQPTQSTESEITQTTEQATEETKQEEASESTEDLFAELFNEEELKKMDSVSVKEKDEKEEEPEIKPKGKKFNIEFY